MFDSREYEWADVTVVTANRDMIGIRGVKYSENGEKEILFAKGRYGHSVQHGNFSVEGELTVLQSELEALIAGGKGSILNIRSLNIIVSYGDATLGDAVITDVIEGVSFTKSEKELKQGDKFMEITLPFLALRLRPQK